MNLLPIPWMKLKLESIYNVNLYGNLYLIFNDINYNYNIDTNSLSNLLVDHNILVDDSHPLYLYLPMELNDQIYKLMTSFRYLYKDNVYIILGLSLTFINCFGILLPVREPTPPAIIIATFIIYLIIILAFTISMV